MHYPLHATRHSKMAGELKRNVEKRVAGCADNLAVAKALRQKLLAKFFEPFASRASFFALSRRTVVFEEVFQCVSDPDE